MTAGNPQCGDIDTVVGGLRNTQWDQELHKLNSSKLEETTNAEHLDPSRWDEELGGLESTTMESTGGNGSVRDALGTARWDQELGELGSSQLEKAPPMIRVDEDARKQVDADEHDVVPNPLEASNSENEPRSRQERRQQKRQKRRQDDSNSDVRNDAGDGHLPLHVENDIADLGTLLSLMQPQDIGRAHEFGPTLEEYAVKGVPVDCGDNWDRATIDTAISRGPHQSALTPDALKLFEEDIAYQVEAGFAKVVLWDDIKHDPPSQLKASPVAAVPQKN